MQKPRLLVCKGILYQGNTNYNERHKSRNPVSDGEEAMEGKKVSKKHKMIEIHGVTMKFLTKVNTFLS